MQIYTTFIRKVNELKFEKQRDRRANYEVVRAEPTRWEKYTKYMSMLEEDDGSFPRVSELSMRIEQDRMAKESRQRLKQAELLSKQKTLELEKKRIEERDRILNAKETPPGTSREKIMPNLLLGVLANEEDIFGGIKVDDNQVKLFDASQNMTSMLMKDNNSSGMQTSSANRDLGKVYDNKSPFKIPSDPLQLNLG